MGEQPKELDPNKEFDDSTDKTNKLLEQSLKELKKITKELNKLNKQLL